MTKPLKPDPVRNPARKSGKHPKMRASMLVLVSGLVGMFLGVLLLAFFAGGVIYDFEDTVHGDVLPPVDAIICLAGGKGRIPVAADLWYRYWTRVQKTLKE